MEEKHLEVYKQADLSGYSLKQRMLIRLADWSFYLFIKLVGATFKYETSGMELFDKIAADGKSPIMTFWHNRIFVTTHYFRNRGIVVISSQSFDGEYIARFIQRFGYGAVRGSTTRGGVGALARMIRLSKKGLPMGFSVDGPRGPKYVAKSGACLLAKKTGNPIVPFIVETENYWEVKSWDHLQIPKPFSRAKVFISEPIYISKNADETEIKNKRLELQNKLDELVETGEQWRESI
ncbi:MAG: lysophospholipid acyltransferase family protein [Pyrinomonadaceae bacterium]